MAMPGTAMPGTSIPGTSMGGGAGGAFGAVAEGSYTSTIYGMIREGKYADAIRLLNLQLQNFPRSRAALSLLGYCYYYLQDFGNAAQAYEQLVKFFPEVEEYKIYYAQTLHRAGVYAEATRAALRVDDSQYHHKLLMLQAAIKYEEDELVPCRTLLDQCVPDDPDTIVNYACITYKEGDYEEARLRFNEALNTLGYQSELAYNIALCYYQMKQFGPALKHIAEIIEKGVREHPELSVGSNTDGIEVRSVGNTQILRETALVEAFNLKAAIEFNLKNMDAAKEALSDMPPRSEDELDPVTLHNLALMHMDDEPSAGFRKLNFLLQNPPCPPETFGNLLLLYIKHQYYDLAADVLAENTHLTYKHLTPELYEFLDASIMVQTSPEEAYRKFDILTNKHIENLRKFTKQIQDARLARDNEAIKHSLKLYDDALEKYIPVLMAMARIYWDRENHAMVEKIFRQSAEFCSEHETWKLNVAHVFFMQENKFKESIRYYEPIVKKHMDSILDVTAIVLANLCVSYIMTSQNEEAEELMRRIEREEERIAYEDPDKQTFHLCIVNLVIGTLYCAKGNYEFGISRIMKSLEPYDRKLGTDTWYYAKRCFLGLAETLTKHMLMLKDATFYEILSFLDAADAHGKGILTMIGHQEGEVDTAVHNVSFEARMLKRMFLKLRE
uniref:Tetratricopeptide repeat protein 30 n=1 Tax=Bicosoecida sp. CB-2014 TaxID=1486930 RepID=A0A7S1G6M3_9STRA|mmetsp:Transcript_15361/g.53368  ORF Transcript_15361/g.53368 Transcript_15361/m.53368 type:complete len:670 (+) Transcript_15361:411-2420(+)